MSSTAPTVLVDGQSGECKGCKRWMAELHQYKLQFCRHEVCRHCIIEGMKENAKDLGRAVPLLCPQCLCFAWTRPAGFDPAPVHSFFENEDVDQGLSGYFLATCREFAQLRSTPPLVEDEIILIDREEAKLLLKAVTITILRAGKNYDITSDATKCEKDLYATTIRQGLIEYLDEHEIIWSSQPCKVRAEVDEIVKALLWEIDISRMPYVDIENETTKRKKLGEFRRRMNGGDEKWGRYMQVGSVLSEILALRNEMFFLVVV